MSRRFASILAVTSSALLAVPNVALAAPAQPGQPRYSAGSDSAGDPYFPLSGNGGYDVQHYDLKLKYTPPAAAPAPLEGSLTGLATITLKATQDLDAFNLDLRQLNATSVMVNGHPAAFNQHDDNELTITPRPKLKAGSVATVVVSYRGTTTRPTDVANSLFGWVTTRDGAIVTNEADGAPTWFPVNDHPTDKASYTFAITVPDGKVAVANGLLTGSSTKDGWTTWNWNAPDPMAAYLATSTVGDFALNSYTCPNGVPIIDAVDKDLTPAASMNLSKTCAQIAYFETVFGKYPFNSYGSIVDDDSVGYALETQTRSFFSRSASEGTMAHELAHQWTGDDVSPQRWRDLWLNEGWATYASWLWSEHNGGRTTAAQLDAVLARPASDPFWQLNIADPGAVQMFDSPVYQRGAATLQALREKVGDRAFDTITKQWVSRYAASTATTEDFIALSEQVSGQQLDEFFTMWLSTPARPTV